MTFRQYLNYTVVSFCKGGFIMAESKERTPKQKATRKLITEVVIALGISLVLIIVGSILQALVGTVGAVLLGIGIFFLFGIGVHFYSTLKRIKKSYCSACGAKFDYERDIAWTETTRTTSADKQTVTVQIECQCNACGHTDHHSASIVTAQYDKKKNCWVQNNLETKVKGLFCK